MDEPVPLLNTPRRRRLRASPIGAPVIVISHEKAAEFAAPVGVRLGFAVGVLKDAKAAIELGFPLCGTPDAPERMPKCRTARRVKEGKEPRAEFRF